MKKQEIIDYVCTIVNFCIADGNTYLYAKCIPSIENDNKKIPIGGGNFTVLLSTLATLELLATIDAILEATTDNFYSKEEVKELINSIQEKLKNNNLLKKLFRVPKDGELKNGMGKIIREFLEKTSELTGINKKNAGKLQSVRNKLAHEFTPKIIAAAGVPFIPGADFVNLILQYQYRPVFTLTSANIIGIDSNSLNHRLKPLLLYVIEKIEKLSETDAKLKKIKLYIQNTK